MSTEFSSTVSHPTVGTAATPLTQPPLVQGVAANPCCLVCGQKLKGPEFNWDAETRVFVAGGASVRFTQRESDIISAVWNARKRGGIPDIRILADIVYADDANGGPTNVDVCLGVLLTRIRMKLEPTGYTISKRHGTPRRSFQIERRA